MVLVEDCSSSASGGRSSPSVWFSEVVPFFCSPVLFPSDEPSVMLALAGYVSFVPDVLFPSGVGSPPVVELESL